MARSLREERPLRRSWLRGGMSRLPLGLEERQKARESGYAVVRPLRLHRQGIVGGSAEGPGAGRRHDGEGAARAARSRCASAGKPRRGAPGFSHRHCGARQRHAIAESATRAFRARPITPAARGARSRHSSRRDPRDGQRHAGMVWITGGDSSTLEDFWTRGQPRQRSIPPVHSARLA